MTARAPIAVATVGVRSPLGLDARSTVFGMRSGRACPGDTAYHDLDGDSLGAALCQSLPDEMVGVERAVALTGPAVTEATARFVEGSTARDATSMVLAYSSAHPRHDVERVVGAAIASSRLPIGQVEVVRSRHTGFAAALGRAWALAEELQRPVLTGAVHTCHDPDFYGALDRERGIQSARSRHAAVPSEAAVFFVLDPRRGARGESTVSDLAIERDSDDPDEPPVGVALTRALRSLCAEAGGRVGWVATNVGPERHREREWTLVHRFRCKEVLPPPEQVFHLPWMLGDVDVASGALALAYMTGGYRFGYAPDDVGCIALVEDSLERAGIVARRRSA